MQYAKPVTLNVEECDRLSFLPYLFGNDFLYPRFYVSTSKSIIKALINMHSFEIQLSPIG